MKAIPIEQVDPLIADALRQQGRDDLIVLTKGLDAIALMLKLPQGTKDSDVDGVVWLEEPSGQVLVVIQTKNGANTSADVVPGTPVFGSCKGMLTVVSEDDEHLKDFEEYMR
jgi:hypothetical protein